MLDQANSTFMDVSITALPYFSSLSKINPATLRTDNLTHVYGLLLQYLTWSSVIAVLQWFYSCLNWSTLGKILCFVLIAANFKNFPLIYHLRILNGVRHVLRSQRPSVPLTSQQLFQPLIMSSKASLMETDVFGHKSNSTYFSDVDIARTHLITTMFSKAIDKVRGGTTMNGLSGKKSSGFTIPLGGVSCSFRRELKPYETYDMWTRILAWDNKWIYIVTHFVKKGAKIEPREYSLYPRQNSTSSSSQSSRQNSVTSLNTPRGSVSGKDGTTVPTNPGIAASALSKIVFKNGRITIAPEVMLEAAGLLPPKHEDSKTEHVKDLADAQVKANLSATDGGPRESIAEVNKIMDCDTGNTNGLRDEWTRASIEIERQRGMKLANLLAGQTALEHELNDEVALARHYDGHGIEGVVATLAQLGKLSNYQLL